MSTDKNFTLKIILGMVFGMLVGLLIGLLPIPDSIKTFLVSDVFQLGGHLFISLIKMLVVPVVFFSLVCGVSSLGDVRRLGRVGGKTLILYIVTTALAIIIAILIASLFKIGSGLDLGKVVAYVPKAVPPTRELIANIIPDNPIKAMVEGNMLQIILFSLLFGIAISVSGESGRKVADFFKSTNAVLMRLIVIIMGVAPYGVFCLIAALFARLGFSVILHLAGYFFVVLFVLAIQLFVTYSFLLKFVARLSPVLFFKKMYSAMLFAFSVSSSNASIPVVLRTVEKKLGVDNNIASFVIPLGATINMDGTAIMQGVATVFIAHIYNIHIGLAGYLTVIGLATLASIGTAGVPSVGLITLAMVLRQVGLPVEGIGLIFGVDRLLDMARTAVNISGDSMIACLVGKSEKALDQAVYTNGLDKLLDDT